MANDVRIGLTADDDGVVKTLDDVKKATQEVNKAIDESREAKRKEVQQSRELAAALKAEAEAEKAAATARRQAIAARNSHESMGDSGAQGLFAQHQLSIQRSLREMDASIQSTLDRRLARETAMANAREARGIAEADGGGFGMSSAMKGLAGLAGLVSVGQLIGGITSTLQSIADTYTAVSRGAEASTRGLRDFQSINPGKDGGEFIKGAVQAGALQGLTPDQVGSMGATMQASVDRDGKAGLSGEERKAFAESMRVSSNLVNLGVAPEDAQKVIAGAPARGLSAKRMSNIFMTAAEASTSMVPADMAKMMSATGQYSSAEAGFSAATAISEEERDPGRVMEKVRSAQRALGPGADSTKFTKRLGLKGMSEAERIDAIAQYFIQNGDQNLSEDQRIDAGTRTLGDTKKFGLDQEEAQSVGMLVRQRAKFKNTLAEMQAMPETKDFAAERFAGLMEDPNARQEFQGRVVAATTKTNQLYGEAGVKGRRETQAKRDEGLALTGAGLDRFVNQDTGETSMTDMQRRRYKAESDFLAERGVGAKGGAAIGGAAVGLAGAGAGALVGAALGSFLPGIGTLIGGAGGAIIGGLAGAPLGAAEGMNAGKLAEQRRPGLDNPFTRRIEGKSAVEALTPGGGGAEIPASNMALKESIDKLQATIEQNNAATEANTTAAQPALPTYPTDMGEDYASPAAMKVRRADRNGNQ